MYLQKGYLGRIFILFSTHVYVLSSHQAIYMSWWWVTDHCAGKKSGVESLWYFPSRTLTLLIFSSHQCSCSALKSLILKTLETSFRSIRPSNISISSSTFKLFFLKHLCERRRSLIFIFFCSRNERGKFKIMKNLSICHLHSKVILYSKFYIL